jgi:DNA replication protein
MNKEKMIEWMVQGTVSIPNLLFENYAKMGLNEQEFMVLLHVYKYLENKQPFPTPDEIASKMSIQGSECSNILRKLLQHGYLTIEDDGQQEVITESYSLKPMWEKLYYIFAEESIAQKQTNQKQSETNLYQVYEKEFGRPLSPLECETLGIWIDQDEHQPDLIVAALREAVLSGKLNFRYIDRILFEWKKNNVKSVDEARQRSQSFRKHQQRKKTPMSDADSKGTIPFYNWLEQ